ncbi:MAG TPA: hypothetical protein VLY04_01080 [Bryobacteraceae bacterium]|nr:hypothetical protein [Bryobacteraceae bacterium]
MAKISLNKRIEATKLNERTGAPLAGPEVTIPFGALVEPVAKERDSQRFRFLGELYAVRHEVFVSATTGDEAEPAPAPQAAAAPVPAEEQAAVEPAAAAGPAARMQWERLDSKPLAVSRTKVPGGWLVAIGSSAVTFYPDANHEWDGSTLG